MSKILLMAILVLGLVGLTQADENKLGVSLDVTYMSKLMDKGGEYYGQQSAIMETVAVDLWGTGFGVAVLNRRANSSGYEDKERFDYKVYYSNSLFEGQSYFTKYNAYWKYSHFPDRARNVGNAKECKLGFSWLKIFPGGLVPSYAVYYGYPAGSNYGNSNTAGWYHIFGLGYDLSVAELSKPLHLSADIAYRDGMGGPIKDHDWTHATLGMSTQFKITDSLSFVPGLYHQFSMDDSVCKRDVTYCKLSLKFKF